MTTKRLDNWTPADPVKYGKAPIGTQKEQQDKNWNAAVGKREVISFPVASSAPISSRPRGGKQGTLSASDAEWCIKTVNEIDAAGDVPLRSLSEKIGLAKSTLLNIKSGNARPGATVYKALKAYTDGQAKAPIKERVTDVEALLDLLDQQEKRLHSMTLSINHQADNLGKALRLVKELEMRVMCLEATAKTAEHEATQRRPWWKFWAVT